MKADPYAILKKARERGLLTEPQLGECLAVPSDRALERAVEQGYLSREELSGLALLCSFTTLPATPDGSLAFWDDCKEKSFSRYVLKEKVGEGAQAFVVKAYDEKLGRSVALKILKNSGLESTLQRFQREAQAMARLRHPNIVPVHDIGMERGWCFFAMDYISGSSLNKVFENPAVTLMQRLTILEKVARACHHAHVNGVVHRDLKPENILVDGSMEPFVTDFGIARITIDHERFTQTGSVLGTAEYMSPEHIAGKPERVTAQSDIFSIGAMIYEAATGRLPFTGDTMVAVFSSIAAAEPTRPRNVKPGLSADVEAVILKALEKDPALRYGSAAELADDLNRIIQGQPVRATHWSAFSMLLRKARRHTVSIAAGALVTALLIAGLAYVVSGKLDESRRESLNEQLEPIRRQIEEASRLRGPTGPSTAQKVAQDAIPKLEELLKQDPKLSRAKIVLAKAHILANREEKALQILNQVDSVEGISERAKLNLRRYTRDPRDAESTEQSGIRRLIEADLDRLRRVPKEFAEFDRLLIEGALETMIGNVKIGCELLEQASRINRLEILVWNYLGRARFLTGPMKKAEEDMSEALNLSQAGPEHWTLRGEIRTFLNKNKEAIDDLNMAEKLQGESKIAAIYDYRAVAKRQAGDLEGALKDHDEAVRLSPTANPYCHRGSTLILMNRLSEAEADLDRAVKLNPNNAITFANRAFLYVNQGRYAEALADSEKAIKISPREALGYKNRGLAFRGLNRHEEALKEFDRALDFHPSVDLFLIRGEQRLLYMNQLAEAMKDFERAVELGPKDSRGYYFLSRGYLAQKKPKEALDNANRAVELQPTNPTWLIQRGIVLANRDQIDDAEKDFTRAIEIQPDWNSYHVRGIFYAMGRRLEPAYKDLSEALKRMPENSPHRKAVQDTLENVKKRLGEH